MKCRDWTVWVKLDPDAPWPAPPEDINPEYGGPERYFDEWIREEIHYARQALDAMKARWQAGEGAIEQLQEALMGLEIAAKGQGLLAQARLADAMTGG